MQPMSMCKWPIKYNLVLAENHSGNSRIKFFLSCFEAVRRTFVSTLWRFMLELDVKHKKTKETAQRVDWSPTKLCKIIIISE